MSARINMDAGQQESKIIDFGNNRLFRCRGKYFNLCDRCKLKYLCLLDESCFIDAKDLPNYATKKMMLEYLFGELGKDGEFWFPKKM